MTAGSDRFIKRDGFSLHYCIEGSADRSALIIGSHIYYPRIFSNFVLKNLKMIYMDHRAFAINDTMVTEKDFMLEKLIEDIEALRQKLQIKKLILIGHSIHAFIAIEYVKRYPQYFDKLIMCASSPIAGDKLIVEANKHFQKLAAPCRKKCLEANMQAYGNDDFISRMLVFAPMLWYDPKFDTTSLWKDIVVDRVGSEVIWQKLFTDYEFPDISYLDLSVLLLLGRKDYFNPPHLWQDHLHKFKNLDIHTFEKSGHTPSYEEPELFNDFVLQWLNN